MWPVDPGRARRSRTRDARPWLLGVAGACGLLVIISVVVSVIVVSAGRELELCNTPGSSTHGRGHVAWVWLPPHPECVWKANARGRAVGPPVAGAPEAREAVVFDAAVGAFVIVLFLVALGGFVGWIVLMVREAEQIAGDPKNSG
jgi:hypothetical protein